VTTQSDILAVLRRLRDVEYSELRLGDSSLSVTLRKTQAVAPGIHMQQEDSARGESADIGQKEGYDSQTIDAPMMGTFYCAPRPGEKPFVEIGDRVEEGSTVCIIEVMKLMNSIKAQTTGVVLDVLARDGQMVEPGTPLFRVELD
jgi:acetyl-CoA carboxylase biotin carboxyl carrier protein